MSLDPKTLSENTARIAAAACEMERLTGVPADFAAAQCAQESGWLERCPGNNPFGIKKHSREIPGRGKPPQVQIIATSEWFTPAQAEAFRRSGKRIVPVLKNGAPLKQGARQKYSVDDEFCAYETLEDAFLDYANLLMNGKAFKPIWDRFQQHRDKRLFLKEISAKYATDPNYSSALEKIISGPRLSKALILAQNRSETTT